MYDIFQSNFRDTMNPTFGEALRSHLDEPHVLLELLDGFSSTITHARLDSFGELVDNIL